jgi:hypothetical protein
MPAADGSPVTANEINVTVTAQQDFLDAVSAMSAIGSLVMESGGQALVQAMATTAGSGMASVISMWAEDFNDIKNTLQWMADQLGDTAAQLQAGNQQNTDMALSLPTFTDSASFTAAPSIAAGPGPM